MKSNENNIIYYVLEPSDKLKVVNNLLRKVPLFPNCLQKIHTAFQRPDPISPKPPLLRYALQAYAFPTNFNHPEGAFRHPLKIGGNPILDSKLSSLVSQWIPRSPTWWRKVQNASLRIVK